MPFHTGQPLANLSSPPRGTRSRGRSNATSRSSDGEVVLIAPADAMPAKVRGTPLWVVGDLPAALEWFDLAVRIALRTVSP